MPFRVAFKKIRHLIRDARGAANFGNARISLGILWNAFIKPDPMFHLRPQGRMACTAIPGYHGEFGVFGLLSHDYCACQIPLAHGAAVLPSLPPFIMAPIFTKGLFQGLIFQTYGFTYPPHGHACLTLDARRAAGLVLSNSPSVLPALWPIEDGKVCIGLLAVPGMAFCPYQQHRRPMPFQTRPRLPPFLGTAHPQGIVQKIQARDPE